MHRTKDLVTGVVYTKNTERAIIPAGPEGPLGDSVIASGVVYKNTALDSPPIGRFDLAAVTTAVDGEMERREVSIEVSFYKPFARKSWISKLNPTFKTTGQADEVSVTGVETYPRGGGILDSPLIMGISTGTGRFIGAVGTVTISYDPATELFTYAFTAV